MATARAKPYQSAGLTMDQSTTGVPAETEPPETKPPETTRNPSFPLARSKRDNAPGSTTAARYLHQVGFRLCERRDRYRASDTIGRMMRPQLVLIRHF